MSDDTNNIIKDRLAEIFPSPAVASAVTSLIASNRPFGYGRKSNSTYYKERYALELKDSVDKQIETEEDIVFKYSYWCDLDNGISPETLYQRIYNSARYLFERMDNGGKYLEWWNKVSIKKSKERLAVIVSIADPATKRSLKPHMEIARSEMPEWKRRLTEWLESGDVEPFRAERLSLSAEEVKTLKVELSGLPNLSTSVNANSIKILKMV